MSVEGAYQQILSRPFTNLNEKELACSVAIQNRDHQNKVFPVFAEYISFKPLNLKP